MPQFAPAVYSVIAVFLWGAADFAGGYGSRRANAFVLTAFSHVCAFVLMFSIALGEHGVFPSRASIVWAVIAGASGGFSLAIFYKALASGQMGLAAPVAALVGAAIPTMVDVALEGTPSRWMIGGFSLAILAIWLITRPEPSGKKDTAGRPAGVGHGRARWSRIRGILPVHPSGKRLAGMDRSPLADWFVHGHVHRGDCHGRAAQTESKSAITLGMLAGFLDISASALFIFASQHGRLDEAVVITSLYPAITVLLARLVLKEHFSRWKFVGLLAALAAVPMIAAG